MKLNVDDLIKNYTTYQYTSYWMNQRKESLENKNNFLLYRISTAAIQALIGIGCFCIETIFFRPIQYIHTYFTEPLVCLSPSYSDVQKSVHLTVIPENLCIEKISEDRAKKYQMW